MYLDYSHIDRDDLVDVALPELTFNIVSKDTINLVFICWSSEFHVETKAIKYI